MGFLQLIPATRLSAAYEPMTKTLYLAAEGNAQNYTGGIAFHLDDTFVGGLKFKLMGWVGPLGKGTRAYKVDNAFKNIEAPKQVLIEDAHGTHTVPVRYLDADVVRSAQPQAANTDTLRALYKMPFEVRWPAGVPSMGSVDISYDDKLLVMESASIQHPGGRGTEIVWTFNSLQTGNSQIVITVSGGIAQFVMKHSIDVQVFVLAAAQGTPSEQPSLSGELVVPVPAR
ncbi:hypothetical protein ATI61_102843 [Archangium gephyra]|uniref:Uncharacterized protein n=1 Tax=Archangium gephyra TaxID=48 RepID=A0AAC8QE74_9BACT|nr:hypothetical protein [Archangium gephyra]AKJ05789.1 Hypothetical protein AA314_07415 [Archangium gephyra]REG36465.1 hypothetical protein ATI61_102843 [Archangium gephyra]